MTAEKRAVLGKKVKKLRRENLLPVNLYGKKVKSQALQVKIDDFQKIYQEAGETSLVDLQIGKEEKTHPVLIHNVQVHPVTDKFLHADFHQVALTEKMRAEIPLMVAGESPAVSSKKGVLIQPLNKLEIEALPTDLPEQIEVDISRLAEVDQEIKVKDLKLPAGVSLSSDEDANVLVVKIGPLEEEIAEPKPAEEEAVEEVKEEGEEAQKPSPEAGQQSSKSADQKPQEQKS